MKIVHSNGLALRTSHARAEQGFTLVEILVAIVVLSFGVLGVVGMQAAALQSNRSARNQSTAVALGRELGDMMRGNTGVALKTSSADNPYLIANYTGTVPTISVNCLSSSCSDPKDMAAFDMNQWLTRVKNALPEARVVVCFDPTPYESSSGLPEWDCPPTPAAPAAGDPPLALVAKIGWTQKSLDSAASAPVKATATESRPAVVLPLVAGWKG